MGKLTAVLCLFSSVVFAAGTSKIQWTGWTDDLFEKAKKENRLVILDLEAVWCHWCHVMEEKTYSNDKVVALIQSKFIPVKVDQDSRPDLSNKYEDFGWPATVLFDSNGKELGKFRGFIEPERMAAILQSFIDDPTPGPSARNPEKVTVAESPYLTTASRDELKKNYVEAYDKKNGGWGFRQKYLQVESLEYAILQASLGDKASEKMAKETIKKLVKIMDPVWGGMYQYSVGGNWNEPHFEKIMWVQADTMRTHALAFALWGDAKHLKTATEVKRYLETIMLSPEGVFYTSQDADLIPGVHSEGFFKLNDKQRRAKGMPTIDKHLYAKENAWIADGFTMIGMATGDEKPIEQATTIVNWVMKNRAMPGGGFRHDADDSGRMFLGDTLAMGQTFLRLYAATGERKWLKEARGCADFIWKTFRFTDDNGKQGGFITAKTTGKFPIVPQKEENTVVARFANLLFHYTGEKNYKMIAEEAMKFVVSPTNLKRLPSAGALLADYELGNPPLHLTVVGSKKDASAKSLYKIATSYPGSYKRVEWYDREEGTLPNSDVKYPELKASAAFVCTAKTCSLPITDPKEMKTKITRLLSSTSAP